MSCRQCEQLRLELATLRGQVQRHEADEAKLVGFFRSKIGEPFGRQGDHDALTPAETAVRSLKDLCVAGGAAVAAFLGRRLVRDGDKLGPSGLSEPEAKAIADLGTLFQTGQTWGR